MSGFCVVPVSWLFENSAFVILLRILLYVSAPLWIILGPSFKKVQTRTQRI